jgi:hypothetical protein
LGFGHKSKKRAVAVEAPRASLFDDLKARLVMAVEKSVRDPAGWVLVRQLQRLGAKPIDADDRDETVRKNAPDARVRL